MIAMALCSALFSSLPTLDNAISFSSFGPNKPSASISFSISGPCRLSQSSYIVRFMVFTIQLSHETGVGTSLLFLLHLQFLRNFVWYIKNLLNGVWSVNEPQAIGISWSSKLVTRSCASAGGAVAAMHVVMLGLRLVAASISGYGCSSHVEGFPLVPSGVFNDVAIAVSVALQSYPNLCNARKPILVVNLDVYQKTDTRRLFKNDNGSGDDYYLAVLSDRLQRLLDFCNPGLVFFQAGVDALAEDISGKLSMTRQGLIHRNNIVYTACFTQKIPLVITMGSGCSKPVDASLEAHADVYRAAALRYGSKLLEP
ncbi:hypothetical protein L7F22_033873 [Adiantum nelumboides]|nr:hypothetical protein [Adiantum nelumboides]